MYIYIYLKVPILRDRADMALNDLLSFKEEQFFRDPALKAAFDCGKTIEYVLKYLFSFFFFHFSFFQNPPFLYIYLFNPYQKGIWKLYYVNKQQLQLGAENFSRNI